jgi:hypothetical protein
MPDLITTKMKLKDVYPDLVGDDAYEEDTEFIRKGITPADLDIKEDERAIISYINTAAKDRDNEIVLPQGADLRDYRKNPVVLFGHDYSALPIGKNMWIKSDEKGLIAKTQYANHDEADKVYNYRKDGFPLAESIGFIPLEYKTPTYKNGEAIWDKNDLEYMGLTPKQLKGVRAVYTKWTMLEYSDVAVPSNPEAMELAKSKGLITEDKVKVHDKDCGCDACVNARKNLAKELDDMPDYFEPVIIYDEDSYVKDEDSETKEHEAVEAIEENNNCDLKSTQELEMEKKVDEALVNLEAINDKVDQMFKTFSEYLDAQEKADSEEEEAYTFNFDKEHKDEEEKEIDFAQIIRDAVKSALESNKLEMLKQIKELTKETFEKMSGKVIKS